MRLVVTQNITLDGVVEVNDVTEDWFGPNDGGADIADVTEALGTMMARQDAALFGRKTFEAMRGYWPDLTDDTTGISEHLNTVDKYVGSTTMDDPEWAYSTVIAGDLVPAHFRSDHAPIDLSLAETRPFESGIVLLTYRTPTG